MARTRSPPAQRVHYESTSGGACMLRRLCVVLVLGILMMAVLAQAAAADPSKAKNSFSFPASCDGQTVQLVVNGNGEFTPAHVVGSTAVFIPQAFDLTFQFTPQGGRPRRSRIPRPSTMCTGIW
jgi:hypothetical protein